MQLHVIRFDVRGEFNEFGDFTVADAFRADFLLRMYSNRCLMESDMTSPGDGYAAGVIRIAIAAARRASWTRCEARLIGFRL